MSARSSFWADLKASFSGWVGLVVAAVVGIVLGVGIYNLVYAGFTDYLGNMINNTVYIVIAVTR